MPKGKKRFIDKRNAVTFCLVNRSQHDPLIADETAPSKVLAPISRKKTRRQLEKQQQFGVYFDDDYNYLQHLKDGGDIVVCDRIGYVERDDSDIEEDGRLLLPSSVFPSNVEEEVGMLNKAAPLRGPQVDWDPDIVAQLDDELRLDDGKEHEDDIEDDFIALANGEPSEDYDLAGNSRLRYALGIGESGDSDDEDDEDDAESNENEQSFMNEETKSQFTNYSMSSSVIRRNEGLTLLDDRFEKFYEAYDDDEIGALDDDEIEGFIDPNSDLMESLLADYQAKKQKLKMPKITEEEAADVQCGEDDDNKSDTEDFCIEEPTEKWDCESILSTYSNIYNHPKLIKLPPKPNQIIISDKTGLPKDVIGGTKLTARNLQQLDEDGRSVSGVSARSMPISVRSKNEKPDERKARKLAVRIYRKERRLEKKANTDAFKEERKLQDKILKNVVQNMQGIRLV